VCFPACLCLSFGPHASSFKGRPVNVGLAIMQGLEKKVANTSNIHVRRKARFIDVVTSNSDGAVTGVTYVDEYGFLHSSSFLLRFSSLAHIKGIPKPAPRSHLLRKVLS
jgi:hypothetical protein